jgi:hypothetical protein
MPFIVNPADFPLLRITYDGPITEAEVRAYLADYDAVLARRQRYALLLDASRAVVPSATIRRMKADFLRQRAGVLGALCLGGAYVITSPAIRGAMSAIFWLQPLPFAHVVVGTLAEGERWCHERLQGAGLAG